MAEAKDILPRPITMSAIFECWVFAFIVYDESPDVLIFSFGVAEFYGHLIVFQLFLYLLPLVVDMVLIHIISFKQIGEILHLDVHGHNFAYIIICRAIFALKSYIHDIYK